MIRFSYCEHHFENHAACRFIWYPTRDILNMIFLIYSLFFVKNWSNFSFFKDKKHFLFLIIKFTWIYEHEFMFIDHFKKIHTEKNMQCLYFRLENPGNWRVWNSQNFLCYESNIPYFKKSINFLFFIQISPNFAHLFSIEDNICIIDQILWNSQNTYWYWGKSTN